VDPRSVAEQLVTLISERRFDEASRLYAEDVVVEVPYAFGAFPSRFDGAAVIREHLGRAAAGPLRLRARDLVVHGTEDPELVVAAWDYEVTVPATGRTARMANVQFLRVRDGRIVHSRDFHDHRQLAELVAPVAQ
jgi:ketosteroid isomerase-like protein